MRQQKAIWKSPVYLNAAYALLSVYAILYSVISLTIIELPIYPTVNRVTIFGDVVSWSITGSGIQDILIVSVIFSASILITFRKQLSLPLSAAILLIPLLALNFTFIREIAEAVFLSTLPIFASLLFVSRLIRKKESRDASTSYVRSDFNFHDFITILFVTFLLFETVILLRWAVYPLVQDDPFKGRSWSLNELDNNLFYAFGLLSAPLFLLSISSFVIRPYVSRIIRYLQSVAQRSFIPSTSSSIATDDNNRKTFIDIVQRKTGWFFQSNSRILLLVTLVGVLPAVLLPLYAYSIINDADNEVLLGVDIIAYREWIGMLTSSNDASSFFHQLFVGIDGGSRPLSILAIYSLISISGQPAETILKFFPVILGPLLVLAVYFLTRAAYPDNKKLPLIAAVMTGFSHQIVIGFYAAFYANWMALVIMYVATLFMLRSLTYQSSPANWKNIAVFSMLLVLALFFHSFTWSYFTVVIALFLVWSAIKDRKTKQNLRIILILGIILASVVAIDLVRSSVSAIPSGGIEKDLVLSTSRTGIEEFVSRWVNLNATFRWYLGGFLTNSAAIVLLFLWTLKSNYNNNSDRILLCMLFVGLLPVLFGDYVIQSRIFYNIPIQIPVSIVMYKIFSYRDTPIGKPLFFVLILLQINYALRAMANMHLELP